MKFSTQGDRFDDLHDQLYQFDQFICLFNHFVEFRDFKSFNHLI